MRARYYLQQLLFIGLAGIGLLFLVEGALRFIHRSGGEDDLGVVSPSGLNLLQPNIDTVVMGGANVPVRVKTNTEGFASPEYPVEKTPGTTRIAFLGNSFTKGFEVDYDKKFTSLVEVGLRSEGKKYEVMNFAQGGMSVAEQLIMYREYVKKYRPDMVVLVVYAGYDFPTVQRFLDRKEYVLKTPISQIQFTELDQAEAVFTKENKNFRSRIVEHAEVVRYLIRLVRQSEPLYALAIKAGLLHEPLTKNVGNFFSEIWSYMDPTSAPHREIMEFTAALVDKLGREVRTDGGEFVVVVVPSHWQVDKKYTTDLLTRNPSYQLELPNEVMKRTVGKTFPLFDMTPRIRQAINDEGKQIYVNDEGHFTATGHELAGEEILQFLQKEIGKKK